MTVQFFKSKWSLRIQFTDNWRHLIKYWLYLNVILSILGATISILPLFLYVFNIWQNGTLKQWLPVEGGQLWLNFNHSFINGLLDTILSLLLTIIVFIFIMIISGRLSRLDTTEIIKKRTSKKVKLFIWIICLLLLFFVIPPIIISLLHPEISIFSEIFWLGYGLELLVSFFIVIPFVALWWLAVEMQPLDDTLEAWEEGVVEEEAVEITHERYSFFKWIENGEITGYYELNESKLHPEVLMLVQRELDRIETQGQENGKAEKLKNLLQNT